MSERTEQPTPRRLQRARDEGQHPRSRIMSAVLPTLGAAWGASHLEGEIARFARLAFGGVAAPVALLEQGLQLWWLAVAPAFSGAMVGALAAGVLQAGLRFDLRPLAFKPERLAWAAGLKRTLSLRALPEALRPALAVALVLLGGGSALMAALARCRSAPRLDAVFQSVVSLAPLAAAAQKLLLLLLALASADLLFGRWSHRRGLRMTRDEVKQEHKQQEGDPHQRAKRKALHRSLALAGPVRSVARATVVVVNPTHIAVALRYAPAECAAPYVVARGRDDDAFEIRKAARAMRVPIVRDVPLARSLVHCQPGDEIPEELFRAAAAILKAVLPSAPTSQTTGAGP